MYRENLVYGQVLGAGLGHMQITDEIIAQSRGFIEHLEAPDKAS